MLETDLRNLLARQIEVLERGLTLLDVERHIPSTLGTRGFIDLLARDTNNHWVLVELKRSNSAARQAIHEVLKYVEGVKAHLGARDDEIRVIIVSTDWRELLVPFSRFVADTTTAVAGMSIIVEDEETISGTTVEPLPVTRGRALAPWHEMNAYVNKKSLAKGIRTYCASCVEKGITDYVLVILRAPVGFHKRVLSTTRASLEEVHKRTTGRIDHKEINRTLSKMPNLRHIIYFAPQIISRAQCLGIISTDTSAAREARDIISDMEEEDALRYLHEAVYGFDPRPHSDYYEIGYAAKFKSKLIDNEGWIVQRIYRGGTFKRNTLLSDAAIIEELSGSTGSSGQRFKRTIKISNKAHVETARAELKACLSNNPLWRCDILRNIDEIAVEHPTAEVEISVYNPSAGLLTLFLAATHETGILYTPTYHLIVCTAKPITMYFGDLVGEGSASTLNPLLERFYERDLGGLLLTATFGYYEARDAEILEAAGLVYRSFRCDIDGDDRVFFEHRNGTWRGVSRREPFQGMKEYLRQSDVLLRRLVRKIAPRMCGGIIDGTSNERPLDELVDEARAAADDAHYLSPPTICDLCECTFEGEKYMIDGRVRGGAWGCMCADCFAEYGDGIGWGKGQLYRAEPNGRWLLVAGHDPQMSRGPKKKRGTR